MRRAPGSPGCRPTSARRPAWVTGRAWTLAPQAVDRDDRGRRDHRLSLSRCDSVSKPAAVLRDHRIPVSRHYIPRQRLRDRRDDRLHGRTRRGLQEREPEQPPGLEVQFGTHGTMGCVPGRRVDSEGHPLGWWPSAAEAAPIVRLLRRLPSRGVDLLRRGQRVGRLSRVCRGAYSRPHCRNGDSRAEPPYSWLGVQLGFKTCVGHMR